jgi:hypothetical protein
MKRTTYIAVLIISLICNISLSYAQRNKVDESVLRDAITAKNFTFKALTAYPSQGRAVQLTSNYDVRIKADTLISYLPYYGRAYSAQVYTGESPLRFTGKIAQYNVKQRRKGGWEITVHPEDKDVRLLLLTVHTNGRASMNVLSHSRQSINFHGEIVAKTNK